MGISGGRGKQQPADIDGNVRAINEEEGPTVVKIAIPAELYESYKELANSQQISVADLMLSRLTRCVGHSSVRSLYLSESQLRQLEQIIQKRPIETADAALSTIAAAFRFRIDQFEPVAVSAAQAKRLHLAAYGGYTAQQHLERLIQGVIARATGT